MNADPLKKFGEHVRSRREALKAATQLGGPSFSLRAVAKRLQVMPSYLSAVEAGRTNPSTAFVEKLAVELGDEVDVDVLLAMLGKVSTALQDIILSRPKEFSELLRHLKDAPADAILRVVREVRDGQW